MAREAHVKEDPNERRRFVAETARVFLAQRWPNVEPGSAESAVRYAISLADELERHDVCPWTRTLEGAIDLDDSTDNIVVPRKLPRHIPGRQTDT